MVGSTFPTVYEQQLFWYVVESSGWRKPVQMCLAYRNIWGGYSSQCYMTAQTLQW